MSATVRHTPAARQWIEIRNVDLHLNDQITLRVRSMHGEMFRTEAERPATLDDPKSFRISMSAGTVALTDDDTTFRRNVRADSSAGNFVYFRGGELRFGRLLMQDTDLRIRGGDARTPLDLDLPHYTRQLVAGYSRTRVDSGLTVYMPNNASLAVTPR